MSTDYKLYIATEIPVQNTAACMHLVAMKLSTAGHVHTNTTSTVTVAAT